MLLLRLEKPLVSEVERLRADLRGRWRQAARAVMVLLSLRGLPAAQIAELLECHPATARRWIGRFNGEGMAGLADRPRCGRPRLGGRCLTRRVAVLLARPGPWILPRIWRYLGRPQLSRRTLYRRVRQVAIWRRPKLTARGPPATTGGGHRGPADRTAPLGGGARRRRNPPAPAAACAGELNAARRPPGDTNSGEEPAGRRAGRDRGDRRHLGLPAGPPLRGGLHRLARMLTEAFPRVPVIVVICDNDNIHHARTVTAYLDRHPRLELLYGTRYSPYDNPAERIWAALKNYVANTAVSWPGRLRHAEILAR